METHQILSFPTLITGIMTEVGHTIAIDRNIVSPGEDVIDINLSSNGSVCVKSEVTRVFTRSAPYFAWSRNENPLLIEARPSRSVASINERRSKLVDLTLESTHVTKGALSPTIRMTPFGDESTVAPFDGNNSSPASEATPRADTPMGATRRYQVGRQSGLQFASKAATPLAVDSVSNPTSHLSRAVQRRAVGGATTGSTPAPRSTLGAFDFHQLRMAQSPTGALAGLSAELQALVKLRDAEREKEREVLRQAAAHRQAALAQQQAEAQARLLQSGTVVPSAVTASSPAHAAATRRAVAAAQAQAQQMHLEAQAANPYGPAPSAAEGLHQLRSLLQTGEEEPVSMPTTTSSASTSGAASVPVASSMIITATVPLKMDEHDDNRYAPGSAIWQQQGGAGGIDYWSGEDLKILRKGLIAAESLDRAASRSRLRAEGRVAPALDDSLFVDPMTEPTEEGDEAALHLMLELTEGPAGRDWKWHYISRHFYGGLRTAMGVRSKCIRLLDAVRRKGGAAAAALAMHANGPLVSGNAATPVVVAAVNLALEKIEGRGARMR